MGYEKKALREIVEELVAPLEVTAVTEQITLVNQGQFECLSRVEKELYNEIRNEKRKGEWLAGRAAAKKAIRKHFKITETETIEVLRKPSGAPYSPQVNCGISITHSGDTAIAVAGTLTLGIDLEQIETRPDSFVKTFFSDAEQSYLESISNDRDRHITQFWTVKEAVSKVVKRGGSLNFKHIDSTINPVSLEGTTKVPHYSAWNENVVVTIALQEEVCNG